MMETHLLERELQHAIHGEFDKCGEILEQLVKVYPDNESVLFNYGWYLLHQGQFTEGYKRLEAGRSLKCYGNGGCGSPAPIWNPQFHLLKGRTILLAMEGGYGDEMLHARFVKVLHELGGKVVLMAHPDLHGLFSRIPNVEKLISVREVRETPHDYWLPGFSAAWVSGQNNERLERAPYLSAEPSHIEKWKGRIADTGKLRVGLKWSGNPQFEHHQFRKFPEQLLFDAVLSDRVQAYSLQRDHDLVALPAGVVDLKDELASWEDTAAAIAQLDLVVTSCTAIAHLAGAMGKPTWVVLPVLSYHCWALPGRTSPWYDTVRLFRQEKFGEWDAPFALLMIELQELVSH